MTSAIRAVRLRLRVERRTEIISASASVNNSQLWYLRREVLPTSSSKQGHEFFREVGQRALERQRHVCG